MSRLAAIEGRMVAATFGDRVVHGQLLPSGDGHAVLTPFDVLPVNDSTPITLLPPEATAEPAIADAQDLASVQARASASPADPDSLLSLRTSSPDDDLPAVLRPTTAAEPNPYERFFRLTKV